MYLARIRRLPIIRTTAVLIVLGSAVWLGARLHSHLASGLSFLDVLSRPASVIGRAGLRLPGGILLAALIAPIVSRVAKVDLLLMGDVAAPFAAGAIAVGRWGCFLHGCCFGTRLDAPWSVTFPEGSEAALNHLARSLVAAGEPSLPVHPLQLYLSISAAAVMGLLLWRSRSATRAGEVSLLLVALMGLSMAALEHFREGALVTAVPFRFEIPLIAGTVALIALYRRQRQGPVASERRGEP